MAEHEKSREPVLHLIDAGIDMTFEDLIGLFRSLTGRDPSPEELEEVKKEWDGTSQVRAASRGYR